MLKGFLSLFNKESLLDQALKDTHTMLLQAETMVRVARQALRETEHAPAELDISKMDQVVNRYESEVRRKVFTHLTVMGNEEVYPALVLISIIIDVERVGDYAKNIVELAREHEPRLQAGEFETELCRIEEQVIERLLPQGRQCFQQNDEKAAATLIADLNWVNPACDRITNILVSGRQPVDLPPFTQVALALYVRYLKRINSHWLNILTSLVNPFDRIGFRRAPLD
ncbi:MAG: PhoU domain-containing protein [bacterium]|jgi:phosphate uptake regulator|nr:PhoU domain-containing protein [bacterium]